MATKKLPHFLPVAKRSKKSRPRTPRSFSRARRPQDKRNGSGQASVYQKIRTPRSLVDAVNQGWEVREQLSSWRFKGANARAGFFRLEKPGSSGTSLMIRYRALYDLGKPYFL